VRRSAPSVLLACSLLVLAVSAPAQLVFDDVAAAAGVDAITYGRACAMVDLDLDGQLDLIAADGEDVLRFYRQRPDHTFQLMNSAWGISTTPTTNWCVLVADLDNDADPDVYVATGGFNQEKPNKLLRNDLSTSGLFVDVSASSGDANLNTLAFGATLLDYDLDGDLDIFVSDSWRIAFIGGCHLLRNDGNLVFTEVSAQAGVDIPGDYRHCTMGDVNNDGWPDVAVGAMKQPSLLLLNNQDGTFTDIATDAGVDLPSSNFGMVLEDFDNDGWMDIYLPKYQGTPTEPSGLYLNNQDNTFTDVTVSSGITGQEDMGHNTADLDADGYPDIFIGTGNPTVGDLDRLFRITPDQVAGLIATDISVSSGIQASGNSRTHGMAFGDYDEDGDLDIFVGTGGMGGNPTSHEPDRLFRNQGNANNWLQLDLTGVLTSRSPIGARADLLTDSGRVIYRHLTAGKGFGNTDSPTLHFGLGTDTTANRLHVRWPSGIDQLVLGAAVNTRSAAIETGARLVGDALIGELAELQFAGPPNRPVDIIAGIDRVELFKPQFGGYLELVPIFGPYSIQLNANGRFDLPFLVPDVPALQGATIYVQTWTRPSSGSYGGTLSNLVTILIG